MEFKESKTYANILTAFAGESEARNKYTYYAEKAKQDGYVQIQKVFEETASNERAHAEIWFGLLGGGPGMTEDNLKAAAAGEHYEWSDMYASFAETAKTEGYDSIAFLFQGVASIEREHENRFLKYEAQLREQAVFQKLEKTVWKCENCGYESTGEAAPEVCPICGRKRGYFAPAKETLG